MLKRILKPFRVASEKVSDFFLYQYCLANVHAYFAFEEIFSNPENKELRALMEKLMPQEPNNTPKKDK